MTEDGRTGPAAAAPNAQDVFDRVWQAMSDQGRQSVLRGEGFPLRGPGGTRSPLGHLLTDRECAALEAGRDRSETGHDHLPARLEMHAALIEDLETAHACATGEFRAAFQLEARRIAKARGLAAPRPTWTERIAGWQELIRRF